MEKELTELVGARVRRLRAQSGLGLRELARETGVSASALSALENNRGGMSLGRLQVIASHFGLHVTELLAPPGANGRSPTVEVTRRAATSVPSVPRGKKCRYQVIGSGQNHQIQPYLITFEPGGSYQEDQIGHPGEEFTYVLLGEVELLLGEEVHRLEQGDMVRFTSDSPHAFRNPSESVPALLIGAATPPW